MKLLPTTPEPILIKKNPPKYNALLVLPPKKSKDIVHYLEDYTPTTTFDAWA